MFLFFFNMPKQLISRNRYGKRIRRNIIFILDASNLMIIVYGFHWFYHNRNILSKKAWVTLNVDYDQIQDWMIVICKSELVNYCVNQRFVWLMSFDMEKIFKKELVKYIKSFVRYVKWFWKITTWKASMW